ncbi:hypothetical protein IGW14_00855 [Streptomyces hygroscopicus subsp. hygroscopicus]|nr:hypothetical protein [Streptomyces hygroscopicus]MBW8086631.1 hypothetical protein [Streptomyces hygroscopicus subsp. hygroscopicus]
MERIPPGEQAADTAGFAEDDHGEDLQRQRGQQHRFAAEVVGGSAENE